MVYCTIYKISPSGGARTSDERLVSYKSVVDSPEAMTGHAQTSIVLCDMRARLKAHSTFLKGAPLTGDLPSSE